MREGREMEGAIHCSIRGNSQAVPALPLGKGRLERR
jgi:hypothetical protein